MGGKAPPRVVTVVHPMIRPVGTRPAVGWGTLTSNPPGNKSIQNIESRLPSLWSYPADVVVSFLGNALLLRLVCCGLGLGLGSYPSIAAGNASGGGSISIECVRVFVFGLPVRVLR